nr:hypothetical protein [Tanacetum cinerariifolium]
MSSLFADTHNVVTILETSDAAEDDVTRLQALVDRKKIVISEDVIREILQLDNAEGVVCLPIEEIFVGLAQMGYEKPSTKLTFYKAFFSSQWKFLIHYLLQSLSAKRTSWNKFSMAMASAVICLSKDTCSALTRHVENLKHDKAAQKLEIIKLKARVKRLERANKVKSSKLGRLRKVGASRRNESSDDMEHAAEQAKKQAEIYHLDLDHPFKVLSMQEDDSKVQEVVEVVTTAKLITDVVTTASQDSAASATISAAKPSIPDAAPTVVAAYKRRRKGVIIRDPEGELSSKTPVETPKLKDKGKGIFIETPKPMNKKDQIKLDVEYARKLHEEINKDHEEINKDIDWDAAIDHVNQKSKNPQTLLVTRWISLKECRMMRFVQSFKLAKKRKLNEEAQKAKDLKKRLEVVDDEDDDVFIEATPLARKVPVVDYQIVLIDNKPRFKIIRADETHQLYISFITLLKNFDREDLENL